MRVYFIGSHSTGKTTLARYVAKKYKLTMLPEVARSVLAEMETTLATLRTDMDTVDEYQQAVWHRQMNVEREAEDDFVSDRAFDNLAYAAEHSRKAGLFVRQAGFARYVSWLKDADAIFFIRPHKSLLADDGVRERVEWDSIVRIDGMIKILLELNEIPYMSIESASMQERVRVIDYVLERVAATVKERRLKKETKRS